MFIFIISQLSSQLKKWCSSSNALCQVWLKLILWLMRNWFYLLKWLWNHFFTQHIESTWFFFTQSSCQRGKALPNKICIKNALYNPLLKIICITARTFADQRTFNFSLIKLQQKYWLTVWTLSLSDLYWFHCVLQRQEVPDASHWWFQWIHLHMFCFVNNLKTFLFQIRGGLQKLIFTPTGHTQN